MRNFKLFGIKEEEVDYSNITNEQQVEKSSEEGEAEDGVLKI